MYIRDSGPGQGERSYFTVLLYLNDEYRGGTTEFVTLNGGRVPLIPQTGMVLVFEHDMPHEGLELLEGTKYVMRTDVMYSGAIESPVHACGDCGGYCPADQLVDINLGTGP